MNKLQKHALEAVRRQGWQAERSVFTPNNDRWSIEANGDVQGTIKRYDNAQCLLLIREANKRRSFCYIPADE